MNCVRIKQNRVDCSIKIALPDSSFKLVSVSLTVSKSPEADEPDQIYGLTAKQEVSKVNKSNKVNKININFLKRIYNSSKIQTWLLRRYDKVFQILQKQLINLLKKVENYVNIDMENNREEKYMYSFEKKEEVIKQFKSGKKVLHVHRETRIPVNILSIWKEEADLRLKIRALIKSGNLNEAKTEVEKLDKDSVIRFGFLKKIAKIEGDREGEVNNAREIFRKQPDDVSAITGLLEILIEEGDRTKEEDELLEKLQHRTYENNKERRALKYLGITISRLVKESIAEGDLDEEIRLLNKLLKLNPNNKRVKASLNRAIREQERQSASLNSPKSMQERGAEFRERLNSKTSQIDFKSSEIQGKEVVREK